MSDTYKAKKNISTEVIEDIEIIKNRVQNITLCDKEFEDICEWIGEVHGYESHVFLDICDCYYMDVDLCIEYCESIEEEDEEEFAKAKDAIVKLKPYVGC